MPQNTNESIYMIADTHFGDDTSILRYERRPFADEESMNRDMMETWNTIVKPEDTIYHLGDFSSELSFEENKDIVQQLNGRKILIMGNHDRIFSVKEWMEIGFDEVYSMPVIFQGFYMLSHEPLYVTWNSPYANIFGHVHNNPAYRDVSARSYCVCVERTDYAPVSFDTIRTTIAEQDKIKRNRSIHKSTRNE